MKIKLKIIGLGYNNYYQANILIYDHSNSLIINKKTYNGVLEVKVQKNEIYKIIIYSKFEIITKYIYTNRDIYYIYLKNNLINLNNPTITFQLTDLNYDNLKVERGEIILCQK